MVCTGMRSTHDILTRSIVSHSMIRIVRGHVCVRDQCSTSNVQLWLIYKEQASDEVVLATNKMISILGRKV